MKVKRKILVVFLFLILYFFFLLLNSTQLISNLLFGQILCVFAISFAFIPVLESFIKKNILFTILFLFIFLFTYTLKYFYFDRLWISYHQINVGSVETMNQVVSIIFLFNIIFWYLLKLPIKNLLSRKPIIYNSNLLFFLNISIFVLMSIFGNTNEYIFNSGGYALSSGTGSKNSLTEYAIIFLAASFIYSGNSKKKLILLYTVSILYCLKNLLQGGRIETVMVLFLILIFDLVHRFSFYKLLIGATVSFTFLSIFSFFRNNPTNLLTLDGFETLFSYLIEKRSTNFISNNQGDVLYASERMILLINDEILDIYSRIKGFFYFIIGPFVPSKYLPAEANLSSFRTDLYSVGGGGLAPIHLYVYLSYLGLVILAVVVSRAIYGFNYKNMNSFLYYYGLLVLVSTPRWYAYNPIFLIKFCLLGATYLYILSRLKNPILQDHH